MTLSPWMVYWWGMADGVKSLFVCVSTISGIAALACIIFRAINYDNVMGFNNAMLSKCYHKLITASLVAGVLATFIPSRQTIAIMVVAPAIVNSKPIQQDLPEIYQLGLDALKSQLNGATNK